jgi:hypothetical protein
MAQSDRITDRGSSPTHGVIVHPGLMYLKEVAEATLKGDAAVVAALQHNDPYLMGATLEEGRVIARIVRILRNQHHDLRERE